MEDQNALIDTSTIIDHLRKGQKSKTVLYRMSSTYRLSISTVTVFELYAGATDAKKKEDIDNLLTLFDILPLSVEVAKQAAEIYMDLKRRNAMVEMRDIFISATAMYYHLPVVTLNTKHFERIRGIKLIDVQ
jgi:tRNA(fMet)-specific endonuclease VapC